MNKLLKIFLLVSLLSSFISCKNESEMEKKDEVLVDKKSEDSINLDDEEFRNLTVSFFNWYKSNINHLDKIKYLKGGYVNETDSSAYYIDEKEVTNYIGEFEKSGFVSHSYAKKLKTHLLAVSQELKDEKIYDGVISGLDYDLITKSQDDEEIFLNMPNIKLVSQKVISKDDVENYYELMPNTLFLKINFTFEDKWLINNYDFEYKI